MDDLFNTPEKAAQAVSDLQSGIGTSFWNTMCMILDGNIAYAKMQLEEGTGDDGSETPESIQRIRDKLKIFKDVRNTPENMIRKLSAEDIELPNADPYEDVPEPEVDK